MGVLTALPEVVRDAYDSVQIFGCKLLAVFLKQAEWRRELAAGAPKGALKVMVNQTVTGESATQTRQYVLRSAQRTLALWETLELSTETTDFDAEAN